MDIRLLKKIKKNWTIVAYIPTVPMNNGKEPAKVAKIYRAFYKGRRVEYAWSFDKYELIVAIAYYYKTNITVKNFFPDYEGYVSTIRRGRKHTKETKRDIELAKKAEKVWP